jgi:hypothetical protein
MHLPEEHEPLVAAQDPLHLGVLQAPHSGE